MAGHLEDGEWVVEDGFAGEDGAYDRPPSAFRDWVTADGSPGPDGQDGVKAEPGRFRLYVCYACPWAHRTLILRHLKGLQDAIELSTVHWLMRDRGWTFEAAPGVVPDPMGHDTLYQIYQKSKPDVNGKATVPVLWDKKDERIVNNESADIIRMLTRAWDAYTDSDLDTYPAALRSEIDEVNDRVYEHVNNGVYKAGFATDQKVHAREVRALFDTLDWLEARLEGRDHLVGDRLTEADIRLLTTLLRFDAVYATHFKCNVRRIRDYPNLSRFTRAMAERDAVRETTHIDYIKRHYYESHLNLNPHALVPIGPEIDFAHAAPFGID